MKNLDEQTVIIPINSIKIEGDLVMPKEAKGIVLFAHGSGSSRFSPRNTFIAKVLQKHGIATLLFDLLTIDEDKIYENRFNIDLLRERLKSTTQWVLKNLELAQLKISYFGASTGAAAAIMAATELKPAIAAVVSRGGRPDLAHDALKQITAPTLLIVGGNDYQVIQLNREAYDLIDAEKQLSIIPGATHLFEEPGALEQVAALAADWFKKYFS